MADAKRRSRRPPRPTRGYAGKYSSPLFGDVEIVVENGQLVYCKTASMVLDLRFEEGNAFHGKHQGVDDLLDGTVEVVFRVEDGKVVGFSEGELDFDVVD